PAEQLQQIFWEFVQLKDSGQQDGGLGLGLAIVDRLAKLLGHRLEVRSWPGRGSVFAVDMAVTDEPSLASTEEFVSTLLSDAPFVSKVMAVVDDDKSVVDALASLLRAWGAFTVCASDGDELLHALAGRKPDAVIAERNLGKSIDGFTVLNQLEVHWGGAVP